MLEKKQSNQSQRKIQIVDFLDIDTNKITFQNQSQTSTMEVKLAYYTMVRECM